MFEEALLIVEEAGASAADTLTRRIAPTALSRLRGMAASMGTGSFAVLNGGPAVARPRLLPLIDSEWPQVGDLSRQLSGAGSEVFTAEISAGIQPVFWGEVCSEGEWLRRVASPLDHSEAGIAFPVHDGAGHVGVVAFSGDALTIDPSALCRLHWDCFGIFSQICAESLVKPSDAPCISRREAECLKLTASGLTSEDIAARLGLSVHTANQYLANTTHKLDAVNRVHAVAKALRLGIID